MIGFGMCSKTWLSNVLVTPVDRKKTCASIQLLTKNCIGWENSKERQGYPTDATSFHWSAKGAMKWSLRRRRSSTSTGVRARNPNVFLKYNKSRTKFIRVKVFLQLSPLIWKMNKWTASKKRNTLDPSTNWANLQSLRPIAVGLLPITTQNPTTQAKIA